MATAPRQQPNMPGVLTPPPATERSRSQTGLFEPTPRFATASETSARQLTDSDVHATRKRYRFESDQGVSYTTPRLFNPDSWTDSRASNVKSPPPLANDQYELAGGMEGPGRFVRQNGDYDDYFSLERQRGTWSTPSVPHPVLPPQYFMDDGQSTPNGTKPWMFNQLMTLVGGVAGRLFQFCSVPFRGFQAGGGQAYAFQANGEVAAKLGLQDDPFIDRSVGPIQHQLPGNYPEDDYGVMSIESLEGERPRMSKRLRTGENWVMVDQDGEMQSRPSTPRLSERRVPSHTRSPSQIPRPVSRAGAATPVLKRPSLIPVSRRSTMERRSFQGTSKATTKAIGTPRSYSRQSYGSPVMFDNKANKPASPLPQESQRLINKMRREEFEDDARMRRMSSQMSAMLREAREALGSKIDIEDEYADDNGIEENVHSRRMQMFPR